MALLLQINSLLQLPGENWALQSVNECDLFFADKFRSWRLNLFSLFSTENEWLVIFIRV